MRFNFDALQRFLAGALALVQSNRDKDQVISELRDRLGQEEADSVLANSSVADAQEKLDAGTRTADAVESLVQGPELPAAPVAPEIVDAPAVVAGEAPIQAAPVQEGQPDPTQETVEFVQSPEADQA